MPGARVEGFLESEFVGFETVGDLLEVLVGRDGLDDGIADVSGGALAGLGNGVGSGEDGFDFARDFFPKKSHESDGFEDLEILVVLGDGLEAGGHCEEALASAIGEEGGDLLEGAEVIHEWDGGRRISEAASNPANNSR